MREKTDGLHGNYYIPVTNMNDTSHAPFRATSKKKQQSKKVSITSNNIHEKGENILDHSDLVLSYSPRLNI